MDAGISRGVPMADCFAILRQAPALVLSLGLNDTVAKDALCLARAHKAYALFVKADVSVRTHALKHIVVLGAPETIRMLWRHGQRQPVLANRQVHQGSPGTAIGTYNTPPQAGAVRNGGTTYKIVWFGNSGEASPANRGKRGRAASAAPKSKRKKTIVCVYFSETQRCLFDDNCSSLNRRPRPVRPETYAVGGRRQVEDGIAFACADRGNGIPSALAAPVRGAQDGARGAQSGASGRGAFGFPVEVRVLPSGGVNLGQGDFGDFEDRAIATGARSGRVGARYSQWTRTLFPFSGLYMPHFDIRYLVEGTHLCGGVRCVEQA